MLVRMRWTGKSVAAISKYPVCMKDLVGVTCKYICSYVCCGLLNIKTQNRHVCVYVYI